MSNLNSITVQSISGVTNLKREYITVNNKDTPIIVYCRSGNRSAKAYQSLQDAGYTNLYDLGAISNC